MSDSHLFDVTRDRFDQNVLQGDLPVLVEFGAEWCGPCKALEPVLESLAQEMLETLDVGQADVDQLGMTMMKYRIMSVPTLILFHNGEEKGRHIGLIGLDDLRAKVQEWLKP